ncbi:LOW QUALITY PROTEIN: hypothetical protein Cgig2_020535 [Carnegiea gigantea]|uniref:Uncharacterized protein n=1 Tax=Carnegiea gigantea TaxID=171969 RepID=A0A9Q1JGS9_9CARY|nr:LOW QUALITY PROTEIN: hypothetical protein Cgig2_020535 [Carnegiea gigantea]
MKCEVEGLGRVTLVDTFKWRGEHKSVVRRLVEMDGDGVAVGGSGGGREVVVYVLLGTNGGAGKVTYVGRWTKYMVLKEGMRLEEVRRKVREITGNPRADFDANIEGDIVEVEDFLDGSYVPVAIHRCPQFTHTFALCSYWIVSCEHTPSPVCVSITKYSFGCSLLSGNLKCLPERRLMFTVVNHGLQPVNPWVTVTLQSYHFDILIILDSQLSPHPHPCLACNVQVHWSMYVGGWVLSSTLPYLPNIRPMFTVLNWLLSCEHTPTPVCVQMIKYVFTLLGAVRYSAMFTQDEAYVHRGKPYCAPHSIPLDALVNAAVHIGYAVG